MRPLRMLPVAILFFCCLAFVFPVRTAASVTSGPASCNDTNTEQMPSGAYGCTIPLKVRQPGHGGGSNPNDWGMCGLLSVSTKFGFGPLSVARVIVLPSGFYTVQLLAATKVAIPTAEWTCVLFTDFKGVPPVSDVTSSGPLPDGFSFKAGYAPTIYGTSEIIKKSAGNACIWAGLSGELSMYWPADGAVEGAAYAQFDGLESSLGSKFATTYAFCSGYASSSWKGWKYLHTGLGVSASTTGLSDAHNWCYMDGILLEDPNQPVITAPIFGGIRLSSGSYSRATTSPYTYVGFNCLALEQ